MNRIRLILAAVATVMAWPASHAAAQPLFNMTGSYRCVQGCIPGFEESPAYITQNGRNIAMVNEAGVPIRAWIDWYAPRSRIWMESLGQAAVFSPDGSTIQFDRGTVWQRDDGAAPEAVAYCARRFRSYDPESQTYIGRGGVRRPCP